MARRPLASRLPAFPWDSLAAAQQRAAEHPGGIVNLSVGTPMDSTPGSVQAALADASDSHGYPTVLGTQELREALVRFVREHRGAPEQLGVEHVLGTIGSKELVGHLPFQLGIGAGEIVAHPHIAYPTYDMGARFVGAEPLPVNIARLADTGSLTQAAQPAVEPGGAGGPADADRVSLLWLNSPSNPTGEVMSVEQLRAIVDWAREHDVIVASDECYALLPWTVQDVPSILDVRVNGGDLTNLLCTYSLSKQSNLAGYRAAFVAGDPALIRELVEVRKQAGMMMPGPIQHAMTVALADLAAVRAQHEVYRVRRELLKPALEAFGGQVHGSDAGLYLWTTFAESGDESVTRLAELGILCAPGRFYGSAGERFVRVALTETDERIRAAADRLHAAAEH